MTIIRDSVLGILIRSAFSHEQLLYPEQGKGFSLPDLFCQPSPHKEEEEEASGQKDTQLCDWYAKDDPENPLNWPASKKLLIVVSIASYAFVVYMSAPIWTPSEEQFMQEFGTDHEYTALGLALFV